MEPMRVIRLVNYFLVACFLFAASLAPLSAQVTATISGRVLDPANIGIGGAVVTVKSVETGATRSATTSENGDYSIVSLPLGAQELRVEKPGFRTYVGVLTTLTVGENAVMNFPLSVGGDAVTVTSADRRW